MTGGSPCHTGKSEFGVLANQNLGVLNTDKPPPPEPRLHFRHVLSHVFKDANILVRILPLKSKSVFD